jgi:hypothetical protein
MVSKSTTKYPYSKYGVVPTQALMVEMKEEKELPILQADSNYRRKVTMSSTEISGLSL